MSYKEHSEPDALLAPLDGEPGPMPALSADRAEALSSAVVKRWSASFTGIEPADGDAGPAVPLDAAAARGLAHAVARRYARLRPWRVAAVAGAMLSVGGLAFGALRMSDRQSSKPVASAVAATPPANTPSLPLDAPSAPAPSIVVAAGPRTQSVVHSAFPQLTAAKPEPRAEQATLQRANALRALRNWEGAELMYLRIADSGARLRERYVASVAAAALCLQHTGEPARALELYQRALRWFPSGDLSEEARLGLARAFSALDQREAEANALREFLAHHSDSPEAGSAERRLVQLASAGDRSVP